MQQQSYIKYTFKNIPLSVYAMFMRYDPMLLTSFVMIERPLALKIKYCAFKIN